ncbi:MAG: DegV family protein, partial [Clostridia bacterium]
DLQKFYTLLRQKEELTTSCVNAETFYNVFKPVLEAGKDILYIGFSSALSGTYAAAKAAILDLQPLFPERKILHVDTLGASLGEGLLVLHSAWLREQGKSVTEVYEWLENNKLHLCHFFTVDDLYYLFKGGRVQKSSYYIANLVNIKPVMHMDNEGRLVPVNKVIGRKKSLSWLAEQVAENIIKPEEQTICISHGDCIEDVNYLIERLNEKIKVKDIIINYVDPVVGAHCGPGTVAIFCLGKQR